MSVIDKIALGAGLVVVASTMVWRYVLNDDQRAELSSVSASITEATREISDSISPLVSDGPTHAEEEARAEENRARTKAQWEALGY